MDLLSWITVPALMGSLSIGVHAINETEQRYTQMRAIQTTGRIATLDWLSPAVTGTIPARLKGGRE